MFIRELCLFESGIKLLYVGKVNSHDVTMS